MYKNTFVFFLYYFFFIVEIFSQNTESKDFNLTWKQSTLYVKSGVQVTIPLLDNEIFDENLLPVFSTAFNAESGHLLQGYRLANVKYENLNLNSLPPLVQNSLPGYLKTHFSLEQSNNGALVRLRIFPLFREGQLAKKVLSFSIIYEQPSQLSAKKDAPPPVYKQNSVLSSGTWYKFEIEKSGLYKIDKDFLGKLGIPTSNLNPKNIRIFGNGGTLLSQVNSDFRFEDLQENAIYIAGEEDNAFDNGDYALLYAKGPEQWIYDPTNLQNSRHQNNIYSDKSIYFITVDQGPGLRIETSTAITGNTTIPINTYQDFFVHELDQRNLFANGQQWLGEDLSINNSKSYTVDLNGLVTTENLYARIRGVAISSTVSNMVLNINGQPIIDLAFSPVSNNSLRLASTAEDIQATLQNNPQLNISVTFNNNGNPSAKGYIDYFEIFGTRRLSVASSQFSFRNFICTNPNEAYRFTLQNSQNIEGVWDISNFTRPRRMAGESSGNEYSFTDFGDPGLKEYLLVHKQDFLEPKVPANPKVKNQNLHNVRDIDYLIITQPFLMNEAKRLADHHAKNNGLSTAVVDLNEIYNEFASGSPDLTAIRDFVRYLYLNATSRQTGSNMFVCLVMPHLILRTVSMTMTILCRLFSHMKVLTLPGVM
ncbi:MAG: C25 family cysteine peptidase [Flavobacteriaceae bacterium]|nr:C25 family cysteine peptidase [Flavobacteriaceae bacterium]